jgi:carboxymethylenebutenolidase
LKNVPMDELQVAGQPVRAYVADGAGPGAPRVVVYHAWWGLNDDVTAFADRLTAAGYVVLAPDLYGGEVTADPDEAKRLAGTVDEEHANAIALAALDRLANWPGASGRIGAIGFSFGAHWAVWSATQRDDVGASIVYYGTTGGPVLDQPGAPVLGHFAADDPFEGPEDVAAFEEGLRGAGREVTTHHYPATGHWFAEQSRDAYRKEAADLAFDRTVEFLRSTL